MGLHRAGIGIMKAREGVEPMPKPSESERFWRLHKDQKKTPPEFCSQAFDIDWMSKPVDNRILRWPYAVDQSPVEFSLPLIGHHGASHFLQPPFVLRIFLEPFCKYLTVPKILKSE